MPRRLAQSIAFLAAAALVLTPGAAALAGKKEDAAKATAALKAGDAKAKAAALAELGKLGQVQKSFVAEAEPVIVEMLNDSDATLRAAAARAVGQIDPDVKVVLPKLRELLTKDKVEAVRVAAAAGIGALGKAGAPAAPDLRQVMQDNDKGSKLYRAAMGAMRSVKPKK